MTKKEIERKRFWFRVRVILEFILVIVCIVLAYKWINKDQLEATDATDASLAVEPIEAEKVVNGVDEGDTNATPSQIESIFKNEATYNLEYESRYIAYHKENPEQSTKEVVLQVNMNLDYDFYDEKIVTEAPYLDTLMVLCNKFYKIPESYEVSNLVVVPERFHAADGKDYWLDERALKDYISMAEDAKSQGVELTVVSAYRTFDFQKRLYNKYAEKNGSEEADTYSARPGHSEHETGLAVDLNQVALDFEKSKAFKWLNENAHLYGFILRYPKDQTHITGYMYEPWHYRYVGKEVAKQIKAENITFEAYHVLYLKP